MSTKDPIIEELMAPGAPFEVIPSGGIRVFKNMPENMSDALNGARRFGSAEFIVSGSRRLSFDDFFQASDALAVLLVNTYQIEPGQSVAICMKNCPEWMIAFVAIMNVGAVAVLVNSRGTGTAMSQALDDTDCVLVMCDDGRQAKLSEAGSKVASLNASDFPTGEHAFLPVSRKSDDLAAMFFTSGTTGKAKAPAIQHRALITGMMNTQLAMAAVFAKMAKAYGTDVETLRSQMPQSCSLLVFPLFHTSGCSAVFLTAMTTGGKLVLMDRWDADEALELMEAEKVTTFGGVPTMHWDVIRSPNLDKHDLSSLMSISCGGQALPLNLLSEIREKFPRAYIGAGYGMTELCGAVSQANGEAFLANSEASGQVLPMVDVQISGPDGEALPIGEVGEIWAKGANLMKEYYKDPKATAASMSGDWYKTGDIGKLDANGYIYIVDRKTDMVISGGENIYCAEVEQAMSRHAKVLQVTAFGVPDERLGECLIINCVVDSATTSEELFDFARENLANYSIPKDIIVQTEAFELNAMGKVEKQKVRDVYLAQIAA